MQIGGCLPPGSDLQRRGRPVAAFDLGAVHHPARCGVEGVAPMHGGAVVPQHADRRPATDCAPYRSSGLSICAHSASSSARQLGRATALRCMNCAAARDRGRGAPALRMPAHERVPGTGRLVRVVGGLHAFAQIAAAVVGAVVLDAAAPHSLFQGPPAAKTQASPACRTPRCRRPAAGSRGRRAWRRRAAARGSSCRCAIPPRRHPSAPIG